MNTAEHRVLVVDDDPHICNVIDRALEPLARCDTAHDLASARALLAASRYEVVLLDVTLGLQSGLTLLDELRARWPASKPVMISGLDDLETARETLARGARGYIVKPFRVRDLRIQVAAALEQDDASVHAARSSARASIVATLGPFVEQREPFACVVVDVAHLHLIAAAYGTDVVGEVSRCIEQRVQSFGPSARVLGPLGPASFVAAVGVAACSADDFTRSLHQELSAPLRAGETLIPVPCRLGVAIARPGDGADGLLRRCEAAADVARDTGMPYVVSDGGERDSAPMQFELLVDIADAIHRERFHVVYQPQFDLLDGACVGVEALARWHHPRHGEVPPSVFVPIAERMGLIGELGELVLRRACDDRPALARKFAGRTPRIAVNVSVAEIRGKPYAERVQQVLRETNTPPAGLTLEITESAALDGSSEAARSLSDLAARGVRLSLDDFGTGYSSFSRLTQVDWSEIKVDRSLVAQHHERSGEQLLAWIAALGRALEVDVVVEGIETEAELEHMRRLGFHIGQGYLLGRPQPISKLPASPGVPHGVSVSARSAS